MLNFTKTLVFYSLWFLVIFFAAYLSTIALSYFSFDLNYEFLKAKRDLIDQPLWLVFFFVHLFFGATATMSGWPLFFKRLVHYKSIWHKRIGKLYVYSILLFTGPTGLYLAFFAEGGHWSTLGFVLMSLAWMFPTYQAFHYIVNGDLKAHYQWIIRSYCMTLSGVTLRLFMVFGAKVDTWTEETTYILSAYVWIFNVILGEIILYFNRSQLEQLDQLIE